MEEYLINSESYILAETKANPANNPTAIFIVGQPGSGKSTIINNLSNINNYIFIDGDPYRKNYDDVNNLKYTDIYSYLNESGKVAGKTVEYLINSLSDKRYNLIIEGTLRTTEVPIKTAELLRNKGYNCKLMVVAMHPAESLLRTVKRYVHLEEANNLRSSDLLARPVDPVIHDKICKNFSKNLQAVVDSNLFSSVDIYEKNNNVYSDNLNKPINSKLIYENLIKKLSNKEEVKRINAELKETKKLVENLFSDTSIKPLITKSKLSTTFTKISNHLNNSRGR